MGAVICWVFAAGSAAIAARLIWGVDRQNDRLADRNFELWRENRDLEAAYEHFRDLYWKSWRRELRAWASIRNWMSKYERVRKALDPNGVVPEPPPGSQYSAPHPLDGVSLEDLAKRLRASYVFAMQELYARQARTEEEPS